MMLSKVRSRSLMGDDAAQPDLRNHVETLVERTCSKKQSRRS